MDSFSNPDSEGCDENDKSNSARRMNWVDNGISSQETSSQDHASATAKCSLCGQAFVRQDSKVFPFCSVRCQQIDLGHWFDESFGLPVAGHEDHPAPSPDDSD